MNCPSENCRHEEVVEQRKRVTPPRYTNFEIRFDRCSVCESVSATPEQRKKNDKQARYAYNKYKQQTTALWGI